MLVKELIEQLKKHDENKEVIVAVFTNNYSQSIICDIEDICKNGNAIQINCEV